MNETTTDFKDNRFEVLHKKENVAQFILCLFGMFFFCCDLILLVHGIMDLTNRTLSIPLGAMLIPLMTVSFVFLRRRPTAEERAYFETNGSLPKSKVSLWLTVGLISFVLLGILETVAWFFGIVRTIQSHS